MSDVFIAYASEDRDRASQIAASLQAKGWTVWWDRQIPAGERFSSVIDRALRDTRCVVALWSSHSVRKDWVLEEAEEGRARGILVPVLLDDVVPPRGFRRIQAATLWNWEGQETGALTQFHQDVARTLAGTNNRSSRSSLPLSVAESNRAGWDMRRALPYLLLTQLVGASVLWATVVVAFTTVIQAEFLWWSMGSGVIMFVASVLLGFVAYRLEWTSGMLQGWLWPTAAFGGAVAMWFIGEFVVQEQTSVSIEVLRALAITVPWAAIMGAGVATGVRLKQVV